MKCGIVVDRLFSWDYECEEERATEIKAQISLRDAVCVVTDHDWAHENYSLEVYVPVHRQRADFKGGIYEEIQAVERNGIDEAEAYEVLAEVLREGHPVRLHYDARRKYLAIFRFRPKELCFSMDENKSPVIQPIYNRPSNLLRKMALMQRHIDDIKNTLDYYGWVFASDPWFNERLQEAEKQYAALEKAFQRETEGLKP